jgi:hypothetical protein
MAAITYQEVKDLIQAALTLRASGTDVQVDDHEAAEIKILDYIEQLKESSTNSIVREAHASSTAGVNCDLIWDDAFLDTDYSFVPWGYDNLGNPVLIKFISKSATKIVVKTLVAATLFATAKPYPAIPA